MSFRRTYGTGSYGSASPSYTSRGYGSFSIPSYATPSSSNYFSPPSSPYSKTPTFGYDSASSYKRGSSSSVPGHHYTPGNPANYTAKGATNSYDSSNSYNSAPRKGYTPAAGSSSIGSKSYASKAGSNYGNSLSSYGNGNSSNGSGSNQGRVSLRSAHSMRDRNSKDNSAVANLANRASRSASVRRSQSLPRSEHRPRDRSLQREDSHRESNPARSYFDNFVPTNSYMAAKGIINKVRIKTNIEKAEADQRQAEEADKRRRLGRRQSEDDEGYEEDTTSEEYPSTGSESNKSKEGDLDYKKLYEEQLAENSRLLERLRGCETNLRQAREALELANRENSSKYSNAENERRERRALERRLSEMEEEMKNIDLLKHENKRLKDENGALIRVISKLSR